MITTPLSAYDCDGVCLNCSSIHGPFMNSNGPNGVEACEHTFCINCFTNQNRNQHILAFQCPCCNLQCFRPCASLQEAILFGEGAYLQSISLDYNLTSILTNHHTLILALNKFEETLNLYPNNIVTLSFTIKSFYLLFQYYSERRNSENKNENYHENNMKFNLYTNKLYYYINNLFQVYTNPPTTTSTNNNTNHDIVTLIDMEGYYAILASLFEMNKNTYYALKYNKLAYDYCIRNNRSAIDMCQVHYSRTKTLFEQQPKLRFMVGDTVEFTNDSCMWQRGTIAELYYRETTFPLEYNAPYRIIPSLPAAAATVEKLASAAVAVKKVAATHTPSSTAAALPASESVVGSEVIYVKEDNDRYIRKIGVRAIHETRYQPELDVKINELSYVYCSKEFITNIYNILKQDKAFCIQLERIYGIKLTLNVLYLYRILVIYPQRMTRTDSGYHIPTHDEVISGIRAYFDPTHTTTPITSSTTTATVTTNHAGTSSAATNSTATTATASTTTTNSTAATRTASCTTAGAADTTGAATTSATTTTNSENDDKLYKAIIDLLQMPDSIFDGLGIYNNFKPIKTIHSMCIQSFLCYTDLYMVVYATDEEEEDDDNNLNISTFIGNSFTIPIPPLYLSSDLTNTISIIQSYSQLLSLYNNTLHSTSTNIKDSARENTTMYDIIIHDTTMVPTIQGTSNSSSSSNNYDGSSGSNSTIHGICDVCAIWLPILRFLDDISHTTSDAYTNTTYECPYIFFFVRYALGQGLCVPKLVLTIYDSMITHLSSSIIKCHNPTCQHNKLDKSNDGKKVIFKKCSRCHAAIYCCRDCQVAHYPIHKISCRHHGV